MVLDVSGNSLTLSIAYCIFSMLGALNDEAYCSLKLACPIFLVRPIRGLNELPNALL